MAVRSTNSEYQPSPPCNRLRGKSNYARPAGVTLDADNESAGTMKARKSSAVLASGNTVPTGSRGIQK
jgi:hypothetical protein